MESLLALTVLAGLLAATGSAGKLEVHTPILAV